MGTKLTLASLLIDNKGVGLVLLSKVCRWGFLHYLPGSVKKERGNLGGLADFLWQRTKYNAKGPDSQEGHCWAIGDSIMGWKLGVMGSNPSSWTLFNPLIFSFLPWDWRWYMSNSSTIVGAFIALLRASTLCLFMSGLT